ncbi:hypothetical protein [Kitasatospora fiedleri]|uniref:hypothetical protein n=1 Tax=Kitasatospora fiedleri TaxID=2991545 RepID=UPI00249BB1D1|nr:hypothetical protein [Kitasatospora fiedleri]
MTAPADDPLAVLVDRACRSALSPDESAALRAAVEELRQQLAALHQGEEPYNDEHVVPTPGQWVWQWNRATPEQRLAKAAQVLDMHDRLDLVRQALLCYSDRPNLAGAMRAALDGRSPDVQVKQACDHRDPNRLGMRPRDLATVCVCGHVLFPPVLGLRSDGQS